MSENRIKELREAVGLKQEGLGRICGVGQQMVLAAIVTEKRRLDAEHAPEQHSA